ncbi:hypothetical protein NDU88_003582 [Pleurodeles waltl]|uniref:Uncharacterized protein n=1 Tax=Pleurodeles waltl TaxID=8319 RepID=A0AAV7NGT0_PLEWA|nr:hypothetical protein NDU88_003582 [Pleurodeles waltl]
MWLVPPHPLSPLLQVQPKRPVARGWGRQTARGGSHLHCCQVCLGRRAPESPGRGRAHQASGNLLRSSSTAPEWCEAPGCGSGGPGTPLQGRPAQELMPRHRTPGGSRTEHPSKYEAAQPPDGVQAPRSSGFRSTGDRGHWAVLYEPANRNTGSGQELWGIVNVNYEEDYGGPREDTGLVALVMDVNQKGP